MGRTLFVIVGFCWVIAALVGLSVLWAYENAPGDRAAARERRAPASRLSPPQPRAVLVAGIYPRSHSLNDLYTDAT